MDDGARRPGPAWMYEFDRWMLERPGITAAGLGLVAGIVWFQTLSVFDLEATT